MTFDPTQFANYAGSTGNGLIDLRGDSTVSPGINPGLADTWTLQNLYDLRPDWNNSSDIFTVPAGLYFVKFHQTLGYPLSGYNGPALYIYGYQPPLESGFASVFDFTIFIRQIAPLA
jgi:hypothetical protein